MTTMTQTTHTVEAALLALSARDQDYATQANGVGFNGRDTAFGNSLADQLRAGRTLSIRQMAAAYKMLRTYRKQLMGYGIDYDQIALPDTSSQSPAPRSDVKHKDKADAAAENITALRRVSSTKEGLAIKFDWRDPMFQDLVRQLKSIHASQRSWDPNNKVWTVRPSGRRMEETVNILLPILTDNHFAADAGAHALIDSWIEAIGQDKAEREANCAASRLADTDFEVDWLQGDPFPFQRAGIEYALRTKRVLIADEMGLGKTLQAIGVVTGAQALPVLVLCPASLKYNWKREFEKWHPGLNVHIIVNGDLPTDADVYIINYDLLSRDIEPLKDENGRPVKDGRKAVYRPIKRLEALMQIPFRALVADESHYLKETKARRTIAAKLIAEMPSIEYRLLLTGTPTINRPVELLSQLEVLDRIKDLGGSWNFLQRYCDAKKVWTGQRYVWDFSGASNLTELNQVLSETCYVRRLKADVMKELPDKIRTVVPVDIANGPEYRRAEAEILSFIRDKKMADPELIEQYERELMEEGYEGDELIAERDRRLLAAGWDAAARAMTAEALVKLTSLKALSAKGKVPAAIEWIENFLASGEKLVVFAHHREVQDDLLAHFTTAAQIVADDSAARRDANVERFQNDPDCNLIVCSLKAAGVGLTLTAASNALFVELGWTPGEHDQAEDRVHRIGQDADSVGAYYLIGKDTIDQEIAELIEEKRSIVRTLADGGSASSNVVGSLLARLAAR